MVLESTARNLFSASLPRSMIWCCRPVLRLAIDSLVLKLLKSVTKGILSVITPFPVYLIWASSTACGALFFFVVVAEVLAV